MFDTYDKQTLQISIEIFSSLLLSRDKGLYGIHMEPLLIDPLMKDPIYVNTSVLGYDVSIPCHPKWI